MDSVSPTPSPTTFDPETVSITVSTTWGIIATPFYEAMGSAECLYDCPAVNEEDECLSSFEGPWSTLMSKYDSLTDAEGYSSVATEMNDLYYSHLSCECERKTLEPWLTTTSGVCDSGSYTSCANPESSDALETVHLEYSSMCDLVLGAEVADTTTTADETSETEGAEETADEAATTTGDDAAEETGAGGGSGAGRNGPVSLTGALLAGLLGSLFII